MAQMGSSRNKWLLGIYYPSLCGTLQKIVAVSRTIAQICC